MYIYIFPNAIAGISLAFPVNASCKLFYTRKKRFFILFMAVCYSIIQTAVIYLTRPLSDGCLDCQSSAVSKQCRTKHLAPGLVTYFSVRGGLRLTLLDHCFMVKVTR